MNKFTIPAILVVTVLVAGVFAFMPVEKASTVHTTLGTTTQSTTLIANQFSEFASAYTNSTAGPTATAGTSLAGNLTATCGEDFAGLVYWTVTNTTMLAAQATFSSTFTIVSDGIDDGAGDNDMQVVLSTNGTQTASGVVFIDGAAPRPNFIIGFDTLGTQDIGEMQITVQCINGGTPIAQRVAPE